LEGMREMVQLRRKHLTAFHAIWWQFSIQSWRILWLCLALMTMKRKNEDQLSSSITDLDIEKCEQNLLVPVLPQVVFCFSICDCGTWMQFGTPVLDACSHSSAANFLGSTSGWIFFFLTCSRV
jgi:hypothetical protein